MTARRLRLLPAAVALLALAGCTGGETIAPTPPPNEVRFTAPDGVVTAVVQPDAPSRAIATSRALFARSSGAVVAPDGDVAAQRTGAALAERLHVPMLLGPAAPAPTDAPTEGTDAGTGASADATPGGASTARSTAAPSASASPPADAPTASRTPTASASPSASASPTPSATPAPDAGAALAAELKRLGVRWVVPVGAVPASALGDVERLKAEDAVAPERATPAVDAVALVADGEADLASAASAQAAGASVHVVDDAKGDLSASKAAVDALADAKEAPALLIGDAFEAQADAEWAVRAARTGYRLPGGGQRSFPAHRYVALYGVPEVPVLGVLGEQGVEATIERVDRLAKDYQELSDKPVVPMLEIIVTVAAGERGKDGNYSNELDIADIEPYVDAAEQAGVSVVIDLQPGRSDFVTQAKRYQRLLERPHVGLALDPEWRIKPNQRHLVQIGSVSADEVNRTSEWLADLVKERGLPPKLFVLHQFKFSMLPDRERIVERPQLETIVHVDGQGSQPAKQDTWRALVDGAPDWYAFGWKNFLDEDKPVLTPQQTMTQVEPKPDLITYQ